MGQISDPHRIGSKHCSKRVSLFDVNQLVCEDSQNLQEEWQQALLHSEPAYIYSSCKLLQILQIAEPEEVVSCARSMKRLTSRPQRMLLTGPQLFHRWQPFGLRYLLV